MKQRKSLAMGMLKRFLLLTLILSPVVVSAADYYVSPKGSDAKDGKTQKNALSTLGKAQELAAPGDNIYILPGTYQVQESQIARTEGIYSIVFDMNKSGEQGKPISYIGITDKEGHRPVFDFSAVRPQTRITAFHVRANWLVFRNFECIGLQVTQTNHTQSENFRITRGRDCTFDNIACHDGMGIGFYVEKAAQRNLFLNLDAYNNSESVSEDGKGGNCDGFGFHGNSDADGNVFIGCRAWYNADDGYDCINAFSPAEFHYCYAYRNGYSAPLQAGGKPVSRGDGNGLKIGGYRLDRKDVQQYDRGYPTHLVSHCIAAENKRNGIYSNHHLTGDRFVNCTATRNGKYNFCMVNRRSPKAEDNQDINGYSHIIENNIAYGTDRSLQWVNGDVDSCIVRNNSFTWNKDSKKWDNDGQKKELFDSIDPEVLLGSRDKDGMLTETSTAFMRLKHYEGRGADFSGYRSLIDEKKKNAGAER